MWHIKTPAAVLLLLSLLGVRQTVCGQSADSIDITHTAIELDLGHSRAMAAYGRATLQWRALRPVDTLRLRLMALAIDSVLLDGNRAPFSYGSEMLALPISHINADDTHSLTVCYSPSCHVENSGMGGFHMDADIHYTVGVAMNEYPHSFGRTWFPCQDDFRDKCTYSLSVTPPRGWTAECGGMPDSVVNNPDSSQTFHYSLRLPSPSYLISATAAPFSKLQRNVQGLYGHYPLSVAYRNADSTAVRNAFNLLDDVVPQFERCLGPYRWQRIGYCATPVGSMEHINNISLISLCASNMMEQCQTTIAHELAHSWFGNLITCSEAADMWWNEGGASYCEELAMEAMYDTITARQYAMEHLEEVMRKAHIDDRGRRPLLHMDSFYTYGTTVYRKGAAFFHGLRGHLGDSIFFGSLRQMFDRCAFASLGWQEICDSLSAYSGHNLRAYFQYHLGEPGFADYLIDSLTVAGGIATLVISQHSAWNNSYCRDNCVPVTFGSSDASNPQTKTVWFQFADSVAHLSTPLGFTPDYAVIDLGHRLSTAAFADTLRLSARGTRDMPLQHFRTIVRTTGDSTLIAVTHHFSPPCCGSPMPASVIRTSNRFWHVEGNLPQGLKLNGMFHFCRGIARNSPAPYLDYGFYDRSASLDSMALLYRANLGEPWQVASRQASGDSEEGYMVTNNLKAGYYTLAIIDTAIHENIVTNDILTGNRAPRLVPNPAQDGIVRMEWAQPGKQASVEIYDSHGCLRASLRHISAGEALRLALDAGIYKCVISCGKNRWTQTLVII